MGEERQEAGAVGFDQRLSELEAIVRELEEGGLGLEPAIERYQRGIELLKDCHRTLATYRARVEELTRDAALSIQPFERDPDFERGAERERLRTRREDE
jgi:exodeoxyribonuclease VII small subunit